MIFSAAAIARRLRGLAREIAAAGLDDLLVVPILKGSFVFAADLIRALHAAGERPEVDFMFLASYDEATVSSGRVRVVRDLDSDVSGRNVLIVDDILESGRTLAFAKVLLESRAARRVLTCVLLNKPVARAVAITADFQGFDCPDVYVVGYGMDLAHHYRELPFVGRILQD